MSASPERRPLRGAIIGLGNIARQAHLPAYRDDPAVAKRLTVVAAVDGAAESALVAGLRVVTHRDALAEESLDFVDICTPTSSHVELVLWALERGYHVLCEKPVAVSAADASRIGAAARASQRVVMACHQYRHNPVWQQVERWLAAETIGRWHLAEFDVYRMGADAGASDGHPWRGQQQLSGGGVLLDHGTHLIYQVLDVAGMPRSVFAWTGRLRHSSYDVEDSAQLLLGYRDRLVKIFLTWAARKRENRIRFIGERGTITWEGGILSLERDSGTKTFDYSAELLKTSYWRWFARLFVEFADAIEQGEGARTMEDIQQVATVLESAYGSTSRTSPDPIMRPALVRS
jgi:predicted dehydrogenase